MSVNTNSNKILKQPRIDHRRCAVCLYRAGLGCVRIGRLLRKDKAQVARWVRFAGVGDAARQNGSRGGKTRWLKWAQSAEAIAKQAQKRFEDASLLNRLKKQGTTAFGDLPLFRDAAKRKAAKSQIENYRKNPARFWRAQYERVRRDPAQRIRATTRHRLWKALKGLSKSARSFELVGCTHRQLKLHIEAKFKPGMSWDNYGVHGWHIDHIRPCESFDLSDPEHQRACFHFTNLQPLWCHENWRKNDKWDGQRPEKSVRRLPFTPFCLRVTKVQTAVVTG